MNRRLTRMTVVLVTLLALAPGLALRGTGAQDATPHAVVRETTLLEVALPAAALPRTDRIGAGLGHFTIPQGTRSAWTPYCCPGPLIEFVVTGSYAVRSQAPIRVVRADGTAEEVTAGTEVLLGPGDGLVSRTETAAEGANAGTTPVELLSWVLIDDTGFGGHGLPGWIAGSVDAKAGTEGPFGMRVPSGAAEVRLRRVELAPGAVTVPPPVDASQFFMTLPTDAAGTPTTAALGLEGDGAIRNFGEEAATVYVLILEPAEDRAGSAVAGSYSP